MINHSSNRRQPNSRPTLLNTYPNFYSKQYDFQQLSTSQLQSTQPYQRPVDPRHVRDIIENFNPLYLEEVVVSDRDGHYYVIDGQNRIVAFIKMNGGRDCLVNCKVFHGLSYEQEADMFYHLDSIKKRLRYCDTIRAKAEAKTDPAVNRIICILARYGLHWAYTDSGGRTSHTLNASKALVESYMTLGPAMFEQMIRLLVHTWKGQKESMTAPFVKGLTLFVKTYARDGREDVFVRKLGALSPSEVKAMARAETSVNSEDIKYARVFFNRYNYRTGAGKLPYRLE